ncbi:exonuclease SbcCD subunit D [Agrilactobacillus yilanensis]|uniref:Exonuclease SbcCD subunit D n=1 Tax=Agrilactobacillus yilanensis TaxID=2485997 RepID=A0ABW4J8M3_9LACO|nr:DNA repair exonuclease [Agrilactobacillus yilanensis]
MKFIHCADAHLDSPFFGLKQIDQTVGDKLYQAPFTAFERMIDRAIADEVAFILIAGDTFDSQNQNLKVQWFLKNQFQRLQAVGIQVYLIFGNHDYLNETTTQLTYPENVHIFGAQPEVMRYISAEGFKIDITGFSYDQRHITENVAADYPERRLDADLAIGLLHGGLKGAGDANYAPFELNDLLQKGYDYWALGHIHHRRALNRRPDIIYAGNLQGRNIDESGVKGFYEINYQYNDLATAFVPVAPFQWQQMTIEDQQRLTVPEVVQHLKSMLISLPEKTNFLLRIILKADSIDANTQQAAANGQLLDILRTELKALNSDQIIYPISVQVAADADLDLPEIDTKYWQVSVDEIFSATNLQEVLGNLNKERFVTDKFVQTEALQELRQAAELKILNNTKDEAAD